MKVDVAVIGGGPAGLAAALCAKNEGAKKVVIIERDIEPGGILNQCIHLGFGLNYFGEELTGTEYAKRFIDKVNASDIEILTNTFALSIEGKTITAINPDKGLFKVKANAIVLAMGCRERTRGAIGTPGSRPAGIFGAGTAQRYVNLEGYMVGKKVLIVGSGDIGLIMARRLTLEGARVVACIEIMDKSGGLMRNISQCLDDFDIPLYLSHTVTDICGENRVERVMIAQVDKDLAPIAGTEITFEVDTVLFSVGLIPENELSANTGLEINENSNSPVTDEYLQTSKEGIFVCGNALFVHDLADNVTKQSEIAGINAARYAMGRRDFLKNTVMQEEKKLTTVNKKTKDQIVCIICPKGCILDCSNPEEIKGYSCKRGLKYAQKELTNPTRSVTTTVRIVGGRYDVMPVRTDGEILKPLIIKAVRELDKITLKAPVYAGDIVLANVLDTGINFIAARDFLEV